MSVRRSLRLPVGMFLLLVAIAPSISYARSLTLDERVQYQRRIEQVYWNHRIWPKENPGPKPPLSALMSDAAIREKVEDSWRMSALLETYWHQLLTGDQLQAEISRMARQTKAPETLRELFAALDDDPFLIAECIARPALAQRRVEATFASESRIHGAQREALARKLAGVEDLAAFESLDGERAETKFVLDEGAESMVALATDDRRAIRLSRDEWNHELGRLAASFGAATQNAASALPVGRASRLLDRGDRFVVFVVRAKDETSATVASVSWKKRAYGDWAREATDSLVLDARAIAPPAQGYTAPALPLGGCIDDTWEPTTGSEVPDARFGHTAVWTGTEMIVWGGESYGVLNSGGRYDPSTDSWVATSVGANVPVGRNYHTAVWTGSEMIVWGGLRGGVSLSTGGRYNPVTDTWAASSLATGAGANVAPASAAHTAVWTGSEMIVWGGFNSTVFLNTGGRYDPVTDTWAASSLTTGSGANVPPPASDGYTAVWTGTEMIVWGGYGAGSALINTGGRYSPVTDGWAASSLTTGSGANVPGFRSAHTAVWTGSEMIVWGGDNFFPGYLQSGGRYKPSTDTWAASSLSTGSGANVPSRRRDHTSIWTGTEMIVWGGNATDGYAVNTGGRYDPVTDKWAASSLTTGSGANVPPPASERHTAVWTGTEMIVWGGYSDLNTGGRYSPVTDTWAASSLTTGFGTNVPPRSGSHTAVWTGSEMLVWSPNGDGRYDPSTDVWTKLTSSTSSGRHAPDFRYGHTAVWTGTEMIVWGGYDPDSGLVNTGQVNTGGRYDPFTASWVLSSLNSGSGANVPSPRDLHTAVWTGTEMIVWGGDWYDEGYSNSGGRYKPSTDTWAVSSLTTGSGANVPSSRGQHTAVWTGTEMIVWGGTNGGSGTLKTGGRYDPSTDAWAASSLTTGAGANTPSPREYQTAVWTGTEMIVWGGYTYNGGAHYLNDGGRYNASTDTWAESSLTTGSGANAPSPQFLRTAIWTGSEMIVWGGGSNTGGRYDPATDTWVTSSLTAGSGANVPAARSGNTAVWTGSSDHRMIVWGGYPGTRSGGLYCAQVTCTAQTWRWDADGDGYGNAVVTRSDCVQPPGFVADATDCDDSNAGVHPGVAEACNGIDDDCDGADDDGGDALCHDDNVCTDEICTGATGCAPVNNTAACDDGNFCTTNDACSGGRCVGGAAPNCSDAIACTDDSCSVATGCVHTGNPNACSDDNVCTADVCDPSVGCSAIHKTANFDSGAGFSMTRVDGRDLAALADAWYSCPMDPPPTAYDPIVDLDPLNPCIDEMDFHFFMIAFGHSCREEMR